ncbi:hypothetical protein [Acidobacterium sp. S8]|uniref:hypothetical protein n=1 Tax=Acidobacterium sp. S8 TaxID=1641854 RepID=UPI00131D323A|nr:hypothetical protein [Acidobacterium sp. S8]
MPRHSSPLGAHPLPGIDQSDLPIFNQDWWIEAACGSSRYRELKVFDGNVVVGRLPYIISRNRKGFSWARDPHWSHLGGPIVDEQLSRKQQAEVLQSLLEQLPRWSSVDFICNPNVSYADLVRTAFKNAGFEHRTELTYVRHPNNTDVMETRKSKHIGHIKRAAKRLDCLEINAEEFVRFYAANLWTQEKRSYSSLDAMRSLIEEGTSRAQMRAIAARARPPEDEALPERPNVPHDAAIVYVWDKFRCYYWLSTRRVVPADSSDPKPHPDAIKFLGVKAMEHAQAMNLIFDTDGVTTPGTENLYRNMFGLREEETRDVFSRTTASHRLLRKCRQLVRRVLHTLATRKSVYPALMSCAFASFLS